MPHNSFDSLGGLTLPLRDGLFVDFRPVRQDDREILQSGMLALSLQSRRFRFFSPVSKLSEALLDHFTAVDQDNHVAWIALAHDPSEPRGLGIARFIKIQNEPAIAEFAITIIDNYQQRGLGTMLLAVLYLIASRKGVSTLRAFILPENKVMSNWLGKLGAAGEYQNGIYRMDLAVRNDLSTPPATPSVQHFRECIKALIDKLEPAADIG